MQRVHIIGSAGSGKSTLARALSAKYGFPSLFLDDVYWQKGWIPRARDDVQNDVEAFIEAHDTWIIEGNYSFLWPLIHCDADTVIALDRPFFICLLRVIRRSFDEIFNHRSICNGNQQTLWRLFGPEGLLFWLVKTFRRRRAQMIRLADSPLNPSNRIIVLRNEDEIRVFLENG